MFRVFKIKSMLVPGLFSFTLSSVGMYFFPKAIEILSLFGLLITFIGTIFIAFAVFSSYSDFYSIDGSSSKNKIFPMALINPKRADEGIKIIFFGFGIQLAHELIKIIIP